MNKPIVILCLLLINSSVHTQELFNQMLSPNGVFDEVYDRFGNRFTLDEIRIKDDQRREGNNRRSLLCSAGYFDLYFESNCGMEGSSAIEVDRRNAICQLFNDLSQFILPANPGVKVNIWVRDIATIVADPSSTGVLGLATGYYTSPASNLTMSGIIDNEIWKTINSGTNSYTNVTSPLVSTDAPNPAFYHGMMAFNFSNSAINWHTDLTQTTASGLYDMYSIALHEFTHALGFASLIDSSGNSKLGINRRYYSRYDLFLNTSSGIPLIANTGNCSLYDFNFNSALNPGVLTPGSFSCATQLQFFGSVNQAVYSPSVFAPASSLAHLEDLCHVPNNYPDDEYYVMSDANGTGPIYMQRYLKPEERGVLCDIGYRVNTTFGNASNLNDFNYGGSVCPGNQVAGINDGIDSGGYFRHIVTVGNDITLSYADILQNDFNAASFECLQDIYGNGTLNTTSGTSFTFTATSPGLALLRYLPVSSAGKRGNITYIFIYIQSGNCIASACNMVNNGGVENGINCGAINNTINCSNPLIPEIYCFSTLCGTPDYFVRGCVDTFCRTPDITVPTNYNLPAADTWNSGSAINDRMLGLASINSINFLPNTLNEGIQVSLQTPLWPNIAYTLTFVARVVNNPILSDNLPGAIEIAGSRNLLAPINFFFNSLPANLTPLSQNTIPNNNKWNHYEVQIMNTSSDPIHYLSLINAGYLNGNPTDTKNYTLIDDISIVETGGLGVLKLPDSLCLNDPISDLSLHLSPAPAGGEFTGNGVTFDGVKYSFDPVIAGMGNHAVTYIYTTNLGCTVMIRDTITSIMDNPQIDLGSDTTLCLNDSIVLDAAMPGVTYLWQDGSLNSSFNVVNPGLYSATITSVNNCTASDSILVGFHNCDSVQPCPPMTLTYSLTDATPGQNDGAVKIIVSGGQSPYTYSLDSLTFQSNSTFTALDTGAYQIYVVDSNGCPTQGTFTITYDTTVNIQTIKRLDEVRIFPNPFRDKIHIKCNGPAELVVYDITSREMLQQQFINSTSLTINQLASGLYLYEIKYNGVSKRGKLIKE